MYSYVLNNRSSLNLEQIEAFKKEERNTEYFFKNLSGYIKTLGLVPFSKYYFHLFAAKTKSVLNCFSLFIWCPGIESYEPKKG